MKKLLAFWILVLSLSASAQKSELFKKGEVDLDVFGSYTAPEPLGIKHLFETNARHGDFGVGLGTTYWPSEYLGGGVELGVLDLRNPSSLVIDYTTLTLNLRYPIGGFAPLLSVGEGRNYHAATYFTQVRVGAEYRIGRFGFFVDGAYKFALEHQDSLLARAGLRLAF